MLASCAMAFSHPAMLILAAARPGGLPAMPFSCRCRRWLPLLAVVVGRCCWLPLLLAVVVVGFHYNSCDKSTTTKTKQKKTEKKYNQAARIAGKAG